MIPIRDLEFLSWNKSYQIMMINKIQYTYDFMTYAIKIPMPHSAAFSTLTTSSLRSGGLVWLLLFGYCFRLCLLLFAIINTSDLRPDPTWNLFSKKLEAI